AISSLQSELALFARAAGRLSLARPGGAENVAILECVPAVHVARAHAREAIEAHSHAEQPVEDGGAIARAVAARALEQLGERLARLRRVEDRAGKEGDALAQDDEAPVEEVAGAQLFGARA